MKDFDIHEDILGYSQNDSVETTERVYLSIPEVTLRLLLMNYSDDKSLLFHLKELVRVYELVRKGQV